MATTELDEIGREITTLTDGNGQEWRYRLRNMGDSSARYGNCEVCQKPTSETFLQVESRKMACGDYTFAGCTHSLFGHLYCLINRRKKEHIK